MTDLDKLIEAVEAGVVRIFFRYENETGLLFWLARTPDMFEDGAISKSHKCNWWNSRYAGKQAFTAKKNSGYYGCPFFKKSVMAHRVVWAWHHAEWPDGDLDHINGNRIDNRIENLRLVNHAKNAMNRRPNARKASGLPHGVSIKKNGRIFAQIQKGGKNNHLGYFDTVQEASQAYAEASKTLGFHNNHGKPAILKAYKSKVQE